MGEIFAFFWGIIKLAIILAIVIGAIAAWGYNKLRKLAENVREALSNIGVAENKKIQVINHFIASAKSYQASEELVTLKISQDFSVAAMNTASQQAAGMLAAINGMAARDPGLKSSALYSEFNHSYYQCEEQVGVARNFYNGAAKQYNVRRTSIPHIFYAPLLGFSAAQYLNVASSEAPGMSVERELTDDGERVKQLLGAAGTRVLGVAKIVAAQSKALAEKGVAHVAQLQTQNEIQFHYLDTEKNPQGPISRVQLDTLFQTGAINVDTSILQAGAKGWVKYQDLRQ